MTQGWADEVVAPNYLACIFLDHSVISGKTQIFGGLQLNIVCPPNIQGLCLTFWYVNEIHGAKIANVNQIPQKNAFTLYCYSLIHYHYYQ